MVYYILIYSIIICRVCIVCIVFYIFYNLSTNKWNENSFQVIEHYILYIIIFRLG